MGARAGPWPGRGRASRWRRARVLGGGRGAPGRCFLHTSRFLPGTMGAITYLNNLEALRHNAAAGLWPWEAEPYRLWSLLDMLTHHGKFFWWFSHRLGQAIGVLETRSDRDALMGPEIRATLVDDLEGGLLLLEEAKLEVSLSIARDVLSLIRSKERTSLNEAMTSLYTVRTAIEHELDTVSIFQIPPNKRRFFEERELFGPVVAAQFPTALLDIEEASKCFALGRNTATVFHLMRVTEVGLNAIARRIAHPDPRPMWEPVLTYLDKQLKTKYGDMGALFRGDVEFLSGVSAHMHAVNLAWRRRVMHIERNYDESEAERIIEATKGLMQHLAIKLSDPAEAGDGA
jgi:hypothetical protein